MADLGSNLRERTSSRQFDRSTVPEHGEPPARTIIGGQLFLTLRSSGISPTRALCVAIELHKLDSIRRKGMPFLYAVSRHRADRFTQVVTASRPWAMSGLGGVIELLEAVINSRAREMVDSESVRVSIPPSIQEPFTDAVFRREFPKYGCQPSASCGGECVASIRGAR